METIDRYLLTFLLNSLWQVSAAVTIAALACRLMRSAPARHRHAVCAAGLVAALLIPVISIRERTRAAPSIAVPVAAPSVQASPFRPFSSAPARVVLPAEARRTVPLPQTAATLVLFAYAGFLAWRLAGLAWAAWKTARICRHATAQGPDRSVLWSRCLQALGLTGVKLRWSAHVSGPVTAARIIILPLSMADAPDDVLAAAIGHEMAHIAHGDFALNLLFELISLPISFQPAAAWLRREIGRMRELACDELVATRLLAPEVYAQSIVRIAAGLTALRQPGYSLGVFDGDILEERIRRLLDRRAANLRRGRVLLVAAIGSLAACVVVASGLAISARAAQGPATDEMRLAGDAYNSGYYSQAAEHFQKAVALDPANLNARLFLAGTYLREFAAAGKLSADESQPAPLIAAALQQYREVLSRDPKNVTAAFGIVSLNSMRDPKEARDLLVKVIADDSRNKEAYYTIAVLDWQSAYKAIMAANHGAGPHSYDQIADANLRAQLRSQYLPQIEEAFRMLQIALDIDPKWPDPMAFMNLVSRVKAPLVDDPAESAKLIAQADDWVHQAIANGGRRLGPTQTAAKIDVDQPAPRAIPSIIPAPPPPPPPPPGYRGNGDK